MRNRNVNLTILGVLLICLGIVSNSLRSNLLPNENIYNDNETNLKNAGSWELSPFIIDDSGGGHYTWAEAVMEEWCSGGGTWSNPYIIENVTVNGGFTSNGITIMDSNVYFIIRNVTVYNSLLWGLLRLRGIYLYNVNNSWLSKNTVYNNFRGIELENSNNNTLSGNTANSNENVGIRLTNSNKNILSNNTANFNYEDTGIYLQNSNNNTVSANIANYNNEDGILLDSSHNNDVRNNTANYNNEDGIRLLISYNNTVFENIVNNNDINGVGLIYSNNISVSGNIATGNVYNGIYLHFSNNSIISENLVTDTTYDGVFLYYSCYNTISNNIANNNLNGIFLEGNSSYNIVSENIANYNDIRGIFLNSSSNNNLIYNNAFSNNLGYNGVDDCSNNYWDNGTLGNYWGDYGGVDANDDGIGDTLYNIQGAAGSQDNFPIWRDSDDIAPQITINTPNPNELTGKKSPTFNIKITDQTLNSTWYRLWNGTILTTNTSFEYLFDNEIDQNIWNEVGNGTVTITFFANDSIGRLTHKNVTVRKDIYNPVITINEPIENELFGIRAPSADDFNIIFEDPNGIDNKWYMLSNKTDNTTNHTWNGYIDQVVWEEMGNGSVIIKFYANDSAGNIGLAEVTIGKDFTAPTININSPTLNELFGTSAPSFNVEIGDTNLDTMWYTLDNGLTNTTFTTNGTINQALWEALPEGNVVITFYANDSAGNIGFAEVTIRKDVSAPIITINNPQNSDVIGAIAPNFDISIDELNLDKTWYSLNGGNNVTFTGLTGTINQALWDALLEGNVIIKFYANDTLGRIGFQEVTVVKTISQPSPPGIPGYNTLLLLGIVSTIAVIIVKKRLNHLN